MALSLLRASCADHDDGRSCYSKLSRVSLAPIISLLKDAELLPTAAAMLAAVSRYPRAQVSLGEQSNASALLGTLRAICTASPGADEATVVDLLRCASHMCLTYRNHQTLTSLGVSALAKPFIGSGNKEIRFLAAKCRILMGEADNVSLFEPASSVWRGLDTSNDVVFMVTTEDSEWDRIKAASLEKVVRRRSPFAWKNIGLSIYAYIFSILVFLI
jgi:hypothetical protein